MLRRHALEPLPVRRHAEERGFKLSLPLTVEGPDIDGFLFREETTLVYMSHAAAIFALRSPVCVGSRLKLAVKLPPKLAEGKDMRLVIKGTIALVDPGPEDGPGAQVSLRLENRYAVEAGSE
jgi:hypothetical protein